MASPALSPVSLRISDNLKKEIQKIADNQNKSAHSVMLDALRWYVEHEKKKEAFKQEAILSLRHYKETGIHLTGEKLFKQLGINQ